MAMKKIGVEIEQVAAAIEGDAGESLSDPRQALLEAKTGLGRVTTPAQILVRRAREKSGLTQAAFAERIAPRGDVARLGTRPVRAAWRRPVPASAHRQASRIVARQELTEA